MKWLLATCGLLALSTGTAFSGPCSQQIDALQQTLSSRDAGAGPVLSSSTSGASREISEAGSSVRGTPEASRSAAEVRGLSQGTGSDRIGPTGAVGAATGGSAASSQDVRLQQQGQPTQAEAARNGTPALASGADKLQKVSAALDRARDFDRKNDSACVGALSEAKQAMTAD
ncbi:MAG: hypothetical protein ABI369_14515 [Acetobacteraceae bacterium]